MNHTKDREQFFCPKRFSGSLCLSSGDYIVEVETPDLSDCEKQVWGDWGPMFHCQLGREQRVRLKYRAINTGAELALEISPPELQVNSPARYTERDECPFYLEVTDMAHGLKIRGYMNAKGDVVRTDAELIRCGVDIGRLLERECDSVPPQVLAS